MSDCSSDNARRAIESIARQSYGRLVAFLSSRTRDVAGAEDALADALVSALTNWQRNGVPTNPEGWLLTAARNRLIDSARHERVRADGARTLEIVADELFDPTVASPVPDERLKLLFVCAHPAIDRDMHTPLMLQSVLGLDAARIAAAFVISPGAMGQQLTRAKAKIRRTGIAFEIPEARELPERLEAVLSAIYAAYGSGWADATGADPRTRGLADEAIWLARVLKEQLPDEPEVLGLLALMLHCEARRAARRDAHGRFIPLLDQQPDLWDAAMIRQAEENLAAASRHGRFGRFQIEAAIQSVHAERAQTGQTDWNAIADFYDYLVQLSPTVGALVGRAAAVGEARGAQAALPLLDAIAPTSTLAYQPYWAVRAHFLKQQGRNDEAAAAFDRAILLADDDAIRRFLQERRGL